MAIQVVLLALGDCSAALPSLKLTFDIQRPSMAVRGATTFDVLVAPVVTGDSVNFNGKLSVEQNGALHNFFLVDSVSYHEVINGSTRVTTCQSAEFIPDVAYVVNAIASATDVSSLSTNQTISCTNGKWLRTTFAGESYNDGVVEFKSCIGNLDASLFEPSYSSTWYAAKLNHADTTFHDGEGLFSKAQKPLKWFECLL
ncbi:hypothetical protein PF003_g1022 [Phytophthora fragariae]|nr:hypothetical protein PF003_g1022 [Phytophthora fragariae]